MRPFTLRSASAFPASMVGALGSTKVLAVDEPDMLTDGMRASPLLERVSDRQSPADDQAVVQIP